MSSLEFAEAARVNPEDFTRRRSLPLPQLVSFLLNLRKGANQDELDRFFEIISGQPLIRGVTQSGFCQARKKLKPSAFLHPNDRLVSGFYHHFAACRWHGYRVLAVDGSTARLPLTGDVEAVFGSPPEGSAVPKARFFRLYGVVNCVVNVAGCEGG